MTGCHFLTLDEELMGTSSKEKRVKALSGRKTDREGQISDVLADALFRLTLDESLHRRGRSQVESVKPLLHPVQECRGELSSRATIMTADRGYGKASFMDVIEEVGFSSIFIMPEHIVSKHPFVGQSHMDAARSDCWQER